MLFMVQIRRFVCNWLFLELPLTLHCFEVGLSAVPCRGKHQAEAVHGHSNPSTNRAKTVVQRHGHADTVVGLQVQNKQVNPECWKVWLFSSKWFHICKEMQFWVKPIIPIPITRSWYRSLFSVIYWIGWLVFVEARNTANLKNILI